jgi:hypothetical protein
MHFLFREIIYYRICMTGVESCKIYSDNRYSLNIFFVIYIHKHKK